MQINLEPQMAQRLNSISGYLQISPAGFLEYAIEQEIARQEIHRLKDEITIQEINKNILGDGQSFPIQLVNENKELNRQISTCQMCLVEFDQPLDLVEGPWFCDDCLALAKGGDFTGLEPHT